MTNETLRMQMLAGVITESEYKAKLQESLWDRIKNTPKAWIARIKGGTPAIMASALSDGGFKIGVPVYAYDGGKLNKITIKSIDYNTGISDVIYEKSSDGGGKFDIDEKESLKFKLGLDQDLSSLLKQTPEEQKAWYDKTVESIKNNFSTKDISYRIEDLKPDTPITKEYALENKKRKSLKESMIGGIVGIGAINQIPPREKTDYETAFEHFLGERYETKFENREQDPYTMEEAEIPAIDPKIANNRAFKDLVSYFKENPDEAEDVNDELKTLEENWIKKGKGYRMLDGVDSTYVYFKDNKYYKEQSLPGGSGFGKYKTDEISKEEFQKIQKEYWKDKLVKIGLGAAAIGFVGALMAGPLGANDPGGMLEAALIAAGIGGAGASIFENDDDVKLNENNPLKGDPGHMTKYRIGVISTLISDAEKDLIKYKESSFFTPELIEKMKGTIERLKSTLKDLKAQYEEEIKAFSNDGMNKNKKIDDQTYRDQMAAIQGGYY